MVRINNEYMVVVQEDVNYPHQNQRFGRRLFAQNKLKKERVLDNK